MFKVITMSDSNYFDTGKLFIETRKNVDADFVLYGPDLTDSQIDILNANEIEYITVPNDIYQTQMQFLKFKFISDQIMDDANAQYDGFTFTDFDTFFIRDWSHVFNYNFDLGITIRNSMVKQRCLRAYTNGGVIFAKYGAFNLLRFAESVILSGRNKNMPEYDRIWDTLELGRPKHKTHYRMELRWWCDQVFLSSLALRYFEQYGYTAIGKNPMLFNFNGFKIGLFGCDSYNVVDSSPKITGKKDVYIKHLKSKGRKKVTGVDKTKEKL